MCHHGCPEGLGPVPQCPAGKFWALLWALSRPWALVISFLVLRIRWKPLAYVSPSATLFLLLTSLSSPSLFTSSFLGATLTQRAGRWVGIPREVTSGGTWVLNADYCKKHVCLSPGACYFFCCLFLNEVCLHHSIRKINYHILSLFLIYFLHSSDHPSTLTWFVYIIIICTHTPIPT